MPKIPNSLPKEITKLPSRSLTLPEGYQRFDYYNPGSNANGVVLDRPDLLKEKLSTKPNTGDLYLYTHHEVFYQDSVIKHTRSSPNWEGGLVTYATCKHLMRSSNRPSWLGVWIVGLCPTKMGRCLMFAGKVKVEFTSNYDLGKYVLNNHLSCFLAKQADVNPRGDIYTPMHELKTQQEKSLHLNFRIPENHTRSLETYSKSSGSVMRPDGTIPKYWRDIEYKNNQGRRPRQFILNPCYLFSRPQLWTSLKPGRATLRQTPSSLASTLTSSSGEFNAQNS